MTRLRLFRSRRSAVCFCDACSQVVSCDVSQRFAAIREQESTKYLLHR